MKTLFILLAILLLGVQLNSCSGKNSSNEITPFGPNELTGLVIFFKKGTTREQIETFYEDVVSVPRPDKGYDLPDGVALRYSIRNGDYEGVGITFSTDATPEQREKLKQAIKGSPVVYKVYENVVPNEIKDL